MAKTNTTEYAQALLELTDGKTEKEMSESIKDFAQYLHKKGLLKEGPEILEEYRRLYNKVHNVVEATVTLTERLSEKMRLELREALKKKYNAREVHILEKVDARLIGGMKVKVGDEVYDASLLNGLKQLQAQLLK